MILLVQQPVPDGLLQVAPVLFYGFAGLTLLAAWAVVLSHNIVRMATYLFLTLFGVAGLYFLLSAELLAAIQLIVYAGGTLILIVFGVMLTSRNPFMQLRPRGWELALGLLLAVVLVALLVFAMVTSVVPSGELATKSDYDQVHAVGRGLLTVYLVPFEIAAVILLVVMIGAAYMARRRVGAEDPAAPPPRSGNASQGN